MLPLAAFATALAARPAPVVLDLWRGWPGADKVFVEARFPNGERGLFLVDTGAAISVLSTEAAERLGLEVGDGPGRVSGLSGSVPWRRAQIPSLYLGNFEVQAIDVAVGVPGAPEFAGVLPVDGILGNNVWMNFTVVVDYPADRIELYSAGSYKPRGRGSAMEADGYHVLTDVIVEADRGDGQRLVAPVRIEIDTGAAETSFWCQTGEPFRGITTLGIEPTYGIGADLDRVPDFQFLTETRRIPVLSLSTGGRKVKHEGSLRWNSPDFTAESCQVTPGLLGYETMKEHRAVFDYANGRFVLEKARKRRTFGATKAWLDNDVARYGDDLARAEARVPVMVANGDREGARAFLERALAAAPSDPRLVVLAARLDRSEGKEAEALARLASLSPAQLAEEGEWVAYLGSLGASGRGAEALALAEAAVATGHDDADWRQELLVGLSDCLLAAGRPADALRALDEAIAIDRGGSGFLFRRALIALADGDRYGAISTLRTLIDVYPIGGQSLWLYALHLAEADEATFRADVARAMARLHPGMEPYDFVGAALRVVGDEAEAREWLAKGYARDCEPMRRGASRDNCDAWYWALEGDKLDEAKARIDRAIAAEPDNSAFRDTAAVIAYARGDLDEARLQAREAARLSPDDPYLTWQLRRMEGREKP